MQRIFAKSLFNNKVAIVTGGGTGIGMATAKGFVELGGKVVIAGRDKARTGEGVEKIKTHCAEGAEVLGLQCNIRKCEEVGIVSSGFAKSSFYVFFLNLSQYEVGLIRLIFIVKQCI